MNPYSNPRSSSQENKAFVLLLIVVSLAFFWVLWPFFGAVFWGAIFALLFNPLFRRLLKAMPGRRTLAAIATVAIVLVMVILPLGLISAMLVQEATLVYEKVRSGNFNLSSYFEQAYALLPAWLAGVLERAGLSNFSAIQARVTSSVATGSQFIATQALSIGQNTFQFVISLFVMLYLLFFLLRDGAMLSARIREAVPLDAQIKRDLMDKFLTVIRATVKGNVAVAALQGALGGLIFWILGVNAPVLWGTVMAFLSLLPAVGAALIWGPVAIYMLLSGAIVKGIVLIVFGVLVIGLVDNILRPILVGKDTRMPDYVILISTLGGMALFGLNGFVIGPVIAAMFIAAWNLYTQARQDPPPGLAEPAAPVPPVVSPPSEPSGTAPDVQASPPGP